MDATTTHRLSAMMGSYPKTAALKSGEARPAGGAFDFAPIEVAQKGFKALVREEKFDVAEVAIVTLLQAHAAGKRYSLLPFVMNGMFHHKSILCRADDAITPDGLAGKRVAMRSYAQTTPTWVRGILADDYGLELKSVRWLSQEAAHVAEYSDPPWVERLEASSSLDELLIAGEVDAIIAGGARAPDARIRTLIPDPAEAALRWHARTGVIPINHMVCMRADLARTEPALVRGVFDALVDSRSRAAEPLPQHGIDLQPSGFEAVRPALDTIVRYASDQALIPSRVSADELYGAVAGALS